ncbi:MAG: hypothetical protein LUH45_07075 [Clostridiales bacterium]|nr:hypothetical protein [Clostridiales bacterium]
MEFVVTRTLNGVPITQKEMQNIPLMNDHIRKIIARVKARLLEECAAG